MDIEGGLQMFSMTTGVGLKGVGTADMEKLERSHLIWFR